MSVEPAKTSSDVATSVEDAEQRAGRKLFRLVLLVSILGTCYMAADMMGLTALTDPREMAKVVEAAGPWGILIFLGVFVACTLMQVPGVIFILVGIWLFGPVKGACVSWFGAMVGLIAGFGLIRTVGGSSLQGAKWRWLRFLLDRLDERPVLVLAALRVIFVMAPALNITVILAGMRFREYVLGSAIGLAIYCLFAALAFDWLSPFFLG